MDDMHGRLTSAEDAKSYILAGNAIFTLRSAKTQTRYTYKVRKRDDRDGRGAIWFVSVMFGPDNEGDFSYMGIITERPANLIERFAYRRTAKSAIVESDPRQVGWAWFFRHLVERNAIPAQLECWHEGRCGKCGRKLTVPESVEKGLGPECSGVGYTAKRKRTKRPATPRQLDLDPGSSTGSEVSEQPFNDDPFPEFASA